MSNFNQPINKTTKSTFDLQMELANKNAKRRKGISFAQVVGNKLEYVNIPNVSEQDFKYFYNPSKLTDTERSKSLEKRIIQQKILNPQKNIVDIVEDFEP